MEAFTIVGAVLALAVVYVLVPVALGTYRRLRGPRYVVCPETDRCTEVSLGGIRAGLGSAAGGRWMRVSGCGRWPEKKGCDQRCLAGIDAAWAAEHWLLVRNRAEPRPS
jgi:hypothetical protein